MNLFKYAIGKQNFVNINQINQKGIMSRKNFKTFSVNIRNTDTNNKISTSLKYKFAVGSVKIPHFSKKDKGGEDALAMHEGMIAVADGVGGWNDIGVDPSKYSKELCDNILKEFLKNGAKYHSNIKKIFVDAANKTKATGSATFCMCSLDLEKNYVHTINLGDSGYMLIRSVTEANKNVPNLALNNVLNDKIENNNSLQIVFKSEEQQHSFNFPYQVGTEGDDPESSYSNVHEFKENDIIVLATDGLWDNLFENQIVNIIQPFYGISNKILDLNVVAELIGETCERYSLDQRYKSPFSQRSKGLYLGGKPDDITIIVAQIVKNEIL